MTLPQGPSSHEALEELTISAMAEATPLMNAVRAVLKSDPRTYVNAEAGVALLNASTVLHLKTAEVATLIDRHGVGEVAVAFNDLFGRPMIEEDQITAFAEVATDAGWAAFSAWARMLWTVIEHQPAFTGDVETLTHQVFHHEKGYNRAINFASEPALRTLVASPPLLDVIHQEGPPGEKTSDRALWLFRVLVRAELISGNVAIQRGRFREVVDEHRGELEAGMGSGLSSGLDEMLDDLVGYGLIE